MVSALIERSGLEAGEWLRRYFEAYLVPLVHCLYRYDATRQNTRNWPPGLPGMTCSPQISSFSCLNRLQLRNNQQTLDLADPSGGLRMAGRLDNPLAKFA